MKDYTFCLHFRIDSTEYKALEECYYNESLYPLVFGNILLGRFSIITIQTDLKSGVGIFHFIPGIEKHE